MVTLSFTLEFVPKVISPKFMNQSIDLTTFNDDEPAEHYLLYALWYYLDWVEARTGPKTSCSSATEERHGGFLCLNRDWHTGR